MAEHVHRAHISNKSIALSRYASNKFAAANEKVRHSRKSRASARALSCHCAQCIPQAPSTLTCPPPCQRYHVRNAHGRKFTQCKTKRPNSKLSASCTRIDDKIFLCSTLALEFGWYQHCCCICCDSFVFRLHCFVGWQHCMQVAMLDRD